LADNDGENASLVRLIHELEALRPLVKEAQDQALVESRIRLNYTWLRRDLERVKSGIQDYIETPSTEPRTFEPLQGDYRQ
jgi:RAQPRD family integrative conjugative element protein